MGNPKKNHFQQYYSYILLIINVTDVLAILHWLRLPERVNFKLALLSLIHI